MKTPVYIVAIRRTFGPDLGYKTIPARSLDHANRIAAQFRRRFSSVQILPFL